MPEKPSFEEFKVEFLAAQGNAAAIDKEERSYNFRIQAARNGALETKEMVLILSALKEVEEIYHPGRPDLLFYPRIVPYEITLHSKPFQSVIHKAYRRNVIFNRSYPRENKDGNLDLSNLYSTVDDLLRTRFVCKYLDGPQFVCNFLESICEKNGIEYSYRDLGTGAGYYSWHFYFKIPIAMMIADDVAEIKIWVEIQLSTQLAEVITGLTHELYESRREGGGSGDTDFWKWKPETRQFKAAYLGHGLHLLEGIIQQLKDEVFPKDNILPNVDAALVEDEVQTVEEPAEAWLPKEDGTN